MRRRWGGLILLAAASAAFGPLPAAELRLHGLFGDGMVLQRDAACPVWGTAEPGREIAVSIAGRKKTATAGADGRWRVELDPLPAGGPHEMTVEGGARLQVRDVLVGEVWLACGGPRMELPLKSSPVRATVSDEQVAKFRLYRVPLREALDPEREVAGAWSARDARAAADFSAVAYLFGLEILDALKVPVGIVQVTAPDGPPELWTSMASLEKNPAARRILFDLRRGKESYEAGVTLHYYETLKAKARGRDPEAVPKPKLPPVPCRIYNGMIAPLAPFGIRGVIFYPTDAQAQEPGLLTATIQGWREDWKRGDLPFGFVQLGRAGDRRDEPEDSWWAEVRAMQEKIAQLPNVGLAMSLDIADPADARPRTQLDVARRLALWAQAQVYGKDVVWSGPIFESVKSEGDRLRLTFKNAAGGLVLGGSGRSGFAVADGFMRYVWAEAKVEGNTVVVWNDRMKWPTEVRYAWADNPRGTLYNKEGLPARPFRTDSWPRR
jgi:sialate O-acetylesterase